MEMKKVLGLLTALLLTTPVVADDVVISDNHKTLVWIVIDGEPYFCAPHWNAEQKNYKPVCYEADMKN